MVIKSERMKLVVYVMHGETIKAYKILVGKPEKKGDHLGDLGTDGKIVL
jgi:hypothetical protein